MVEAAFRFPAWLRPIRTAPHQDAKPAPHGLNRDAQQGEQCNGAASVKASSRFGWPFSGTFDVAVIATL